MKVNRSGLHLANRDVVIDAMSRLSGKPSFDWLPKGHAARTGQFLTTNGEPSDYDHFKSKFSNQDTVDVLAATAPCHCMDGWSFFSSAMSALIFGDTHSARHLAYFAQLRAALSLLACNGIGIFNTINFAVDINRGRHRLDSNPVKDRGMGTHVAVWNVLQEWISIRSSTKLFLDSIVFQGVSVAECVDAISPSLNKGLVVDEIFKTWGVDLEHAAHEREARNVSSYAAHALNPVPSDLHTRLELIKDLWYMLEPEGNGGFHDFDRFLLRKLLEMVFDKQQKLLQRSQSWDSSYSDLDPMIQQFLPRDFLERVAEPDDHVLFDYASDNSTPSLVHSMICRAVLLLRVATSVVQTALIEAGFDPHWDKMQPWLDSSAIRRGFWSQGNHPEEVSELWVDVALGLVDLEELIEKNPLDQREFVESINSEVHYLSQTERAFMWSVCV